ncbi:MAG: InlB B-repeat-containing protein [Dissulfurispiraceae bacterium]
MKKIKKLGNGLFLAALCVLIFNGGTLAVADTVTVSWNPVTTGTNGAAITVPLGYIISYGTQSGVYTNSADVGSALTYSITASCGVNYYIAGQAYVAGDSSDISADSGEVVKNTPCAAPPACAYTYSPWSACQPNGTQTMTILSTSPSGCVGTPLPLTQTCTYDPPTPQCTSYTYTLGTCQSTGTASVISYVGIPSGCSGGATPATTQPCTYVPSTCSSFTYTAWGVCQSNNTQTRTVMTSTPSGCTGGSPVTSQSCTYVPQANSTLTVHRTTYGTVTGNGIHCGNGNSACKGTYPNGTQITLTAKPMTGNQFHEWGGGVCSGTNPVCTFIINGNSSVSGIFWR